MLPVITIARQYGSGGHEVGEKLAKRLNIPFYDKALIAMAAKKSGLSEEVFADADEKATSSLLYSMVHGQLCLWGPGARHQRDAHQRQAVHHPVGHHQKGCRPRALRHHRALRRLHPAGARKLPERVCPRRQGARIKRIVALGHCEEKKAPDFVTKKDKQRANYYNFYSNNRWTTCSTTT